VEKFKIGKLLIILGVCSTVFMYAGCAKSNKSTIEELEQKYAQEAGKNDIKPGEKRVFPAFLTPEKAAEITNEIAKLSLSEIPNKDMSKDPNAMLSANEKIRLKSDEIYKKNGTTMEEVMSYIGDLTEQDREKYNQKLTQLFLESSKTLKGAEKPQAPAGNQPEPKTEKK
jgi:hypothetical protein